MMEWLGELWSRFVHSESEQYSDGRADFRFEDWPQDSGERAPEYGLFGDEAGQFGRPEIQDADEMFGDWWDQIDQGGLRR